MFWPKLLITLMINVSHRTLYKDKVKPVFYGVSIGGFPVSLLDSVYRDVYDIYDRIFSSPLRALGPENPKPIVSGPLRFQV